MKRVMISLPKHRTKQFHLWPSALKASKTASMQEIGHVLWSMNVVPMLSVLQQSDPHQSPYPQCLLVNHLNKKENVLSITTCVVHIRKMLRTDKYI